MGIYRGPGGTGDAVNDASSEALITVQAKDAAIAAQVAAELARDAAQLAETNAETAETNAETAETNAETAATNAASSASAASTSASNAATSATNAANSATAAQTAETNAETAETNAAASASAASTSASNAATSASNASTSATNAANSATAAQAAQAAAEAALDQFDDTYLGAKASNPTVDNDGNALTTGDQYFNTVANELRIWNGSSWQTASTIGGTVTNVTVTGTFASNGSTTIGDAAGDSVTINASTVSTPNGISFNGTSIPTSKTLVVTTDIGSTVQAYDAQLADVAGLTPADNNFIVGNGTNFVTESGSTARTSLGLGSIATQDANNVAVTGGSINGTTVGASTPSTGSFTSLTDSGNLTFTGTGNRITGDFSNATLANRVSFQTSTTNGNTVITTIPNGTAAISAFVGYNNSDVTNSSRAIFGAYSDSLRIVSDITGTGTYQPITLATGGSERLRIDTSGRLIVGGTSAVQGARIESVGNTSGDALALRGRSADDYSNLLFIANAAGTEYARISAFNTSALTFGTGSSGTERMRIDSSGRVGIGTSSPNTAARATILSSGTSTSAFGNVVLRLSSNGSDYASTLVFSDEVATSAGISMYSGNLVFGTNGYTTERMRIDANGNVGIGTSTIPSFTKLQVTGTAGAQTGANQQIQVSAPTTTAGQGAGIRLNAASGVKEAVAVIGVVNEASGNSGALVFHNYAGGADIPERMRIDSAGNLGLGVTPSAWYTPNNSRALQFNGGSIWSYLTDRIALSQNWYINSAGTDTYVNTAAASQYRQASGVHAWFNAPSGTAGNAITFTQAMTLDASGNLGIGTSSPAYKLDVRGSSSSNIDVIVGTNTSTAVTDSKGVGFLLRGSDTSGTLKDAAAIRTLPTSDTYANTSLLFLNRTGDTLTERMRITSGGLVGIGTSSPAVMLDVNGSIAIPNYTQAYQIKDTGGTQRYVMYYSSSVSPASGNDLFVGNTLNNAVVMFTNNTERMRITSGGALLIGTTSNSRSARLRVDGDETSHFTGYGNGYGVGIYMTPNASATGTHTVISFQNPSATTVGTITSTSSATAYNTSSDYRLKENVAPMTGALEKVAQLKPCTYTWKVDGSAGQGFIAHELQAIVPDAVTGQKDAVAVDGKPIYQGVDTSFLVATLTAAIQEQQSIIEELKTRIETLENK